MVLDVDPTVASQIGDAVANQMMPAWGGQNLYFPMGLMWKINQRDREIFADFNGHNHRALARKYEVSLQWIYSVVKRVKKEELNRLQGKLFSEENEY
ncbi:Mor transcription activator family protein [Arsenophonus sp. ENCA]|uniref:Mor transcription activator family protein n=1 Tax=Arsenophonus sp. ENCA TaxID=1987579 RepID=UPI0025C3B464|nr:Mor transcription activator family protein [Arsenophonus sp. ENCA]